MSERYLALFAVKPGETDAREIVASRYQRQPVVFMAIGSHSATNATRVVFESLEEDWLLLRYAQVFDRRSGGRAVNARLEIETPLLWHGPVGRELVFEAGSLVIEGLYRGMESAREDLGLEPRRQP